MGKVEYIKNGPKIGEFVLKYNREDSPYFIWQEKNYYLFGHGENGGHFWGNGSFKVNNGDLTTIKNGLHRNIGGWKRQKDNTLFVWELYHKIGFVLEESFNKRVLTVYWAKINPQKSYSFEFAKTARLNQIINNPNH